MDTTNANATANVTATAKEKASILERVDHTLLSQTATWSEIEQLCIQATKYNTASVCVPPVFIEKIYKTMNPRPVICTVVGFPTGYSTTAAKCFETKEAVACGADEIDMVINIGRVKDNDYAFVEDEIRKIKDSCSGKILKVIIETCLLTDDEKINMCKVVTDAGADYIKTSTGFSTGGATLEDIELFRKHTGESVKIKASGGIKTFEFARQLIDAGADRLGTSSLVKLAEQA